MNREQIRDVIVENIGPAVSYNDAGRAADALLAVFEKAKAPTAVASEDQVQQRDGERNTDHEEHETDDGAATGRLGVAGSHAKSMAQAPSDGKSPYGEWESRGETVDAAVFNVASRHHIHGTQCLCGFESHRARSRTEHIIDATLAALAVAGVVGQEEDKQ